ncbi:Cobalt transporter [Beijerinckiaceae bacterium RH AL1]|nr:cation transporter [Beijerinckiaceae bacterium]VVB46162.1 Cobalt transporter [Beijerinckiaceae bacterium RH CH11]VVB46246.1 Cobalt transporter [Beijerinckiaceae bacterium RH AL8]VVC55234.1 Cobalt transporter [Beijerinckiaceae bacterium RH AL1]
MNVAVEGSLRRAARWVAALNLGYFVIEIAVALAIGSVSLFADSIDFLEDASIGILLLVGLSWSAPARARLGMALAGIILVPSLATLVMAWVRWSSGTPPQPVALGLAGLGALVVNAACAWLLAAQRAEGGSLVRAAFLSARNDVLANIAIIAAAPLTAATRSPWPDLVVGLAIAALNASAAWEVFEAARDEGRVEVALGERAEPKGTMNV